MLLPSWSRPPVGAICLAALCLFVSSCETTASLLNTIKDGTVVAYKNLLVANYERQKDKGNWKNIEDLDTAALADYLTLDERNTILELNKVRSKPSKYADLYVKPLLSQFQGTERLIGDIHVQTKEGLKAVEECLRVLKSTASVPRLEPDVALSELARQHVVRQGPTGETGHESPNGRTFEGRIADSPVKMQIVGECIAYGESNSREIVVQLLVDDGVPSRGHRKNILMREFNLGGVSVGRHSIYSTMAVIDFGRK